MSDEPMIIKKGEAQKNVWRETTCKECETVFKYKNSMLSNFLSGMDDMPCKGLKCPLPDCEHIVVVSD